MTAPAGELARLRAHVDELRRVAAGAPLPEAALIRLARVGADAGRLIERLTQAEATLAESRALELDDVRAELAEAVRFERDVTMVQVVELERAGRVRAAARTYWRLIARAPRDAAWIDRLAGLGHLLERYAAHGGGSCLTLGRSLEPDWWRDPIMRTQADAALAEIRIDWNALPDAV